MKKVLYIVFFLLTLFPLLSDGSMALAQNMASEGTPWTLADKTGQFHEKRCEYCDIFISGTSEEELDENMEYHLERCPKKKEKDAEEERRQKDEEGYDFTADGEYNIDLGNNGSNNNTGNGSSGVVEVVDINVAARALEAIGIGMRSMIISDFRDYNGGYINGSLISVYLFSQFIRRMYGASEYKKSYDSRCIVLIRGNTKYNYIYYNVSPYNNMGNYKYIFYF